MKVAFKRYGYSNPCTRSIRNKFNYPSTWSRQKRGWVSIEISCSCKRSRKPRFSACNVAIKFNESKTTSELLDCSPGKRLKMNIGGPFDPVICELFCDQRSSFPFFSFLACRF